MSGKSIVKKLTKFHNEANHVRARRIPIWLCVDRRAGPDGAVCGLYIPESSTRLALGDLTFVTVVEDFYGRMNARSHMRTNWHEKVKAADFDQDNWNEMASTLLSSRRKNQTNVE